MQDKLDEYLGEGLTPKEVQSNMYKDLKSKVECGNLDYKHNEPPIVGKGQQKVYEDAVDLPKNEPTKNRSNIKELDIPEIKPDGSFEYQIPMSNEAKIVKCNSKAFQAAKNKTTTLSEDYASSVEWNDDKIARDILQNFFDGHGQTLDGVRIKFTPAGHGRYRIRIEGDSSYTADKAVLMGESTKRDDAHAAGNYGEGLKVSVLKLLRDKGATEVKIGSDNWNLIYKFVRGDVSEKKVLAYDLEKAAKKYNGNYLEFETDDIALLKAFRTSIDRFYHSGNIDFRCPDFENQLFGIKLHEGQKGGVYISGQRFEFDGDYKGLKGATIFLKEKPPIEVLNLSRDRTSLNETHLGNIMNWLLKGMSYEDKIKFISSMEPYWAAKNRSKETSIDKMFNKFLCGIKFQNDLNEVLNKRNGSIHINFPKTKYVAFSNASDDVIRNLRKQGYTICKSDMAGLGMQTIKDLLGEARAHNPIAPSANDIKRINIIKLALKKLEPTLNDHFTPQELDTKIYIFDRNSATECRMYDNILGEAITDFGKSKGFWIDQKYLRESDFSKILETSLHELSHKIGGDESSVFSYLLTEVNGSVLKQLVEDPMTRAELKMLNKIWKEIPKEG